MKTWVKIGLKNKEVMTQFWSFANFHKTFLDQSIWICKLVSWWCHHLTRLAIYFVHNFFFFFLYFAQTCDSMSPHIKIYWSKHYSASIQRGIKASLNILIAEIWNFCHFCVQNEWNNCEAMTSSPHSFGGYIHIDWSRNVSLENLRNFKVS